MNHKRTMSDQEARALIDFIRRRAGCGIPWQSDFDYFYRVSTTCELVEATLIGLGYDEDWVIGPFSRMLKKEAQQHRNKVLGWADRNRPQPKKRRGWLFFAEARRRHLPASER